MSAEREWMYNRYQRRGVLTNEFLEGIEKFIDFACSQVDWMDEDKIRCPCNHRKCQNRRYLEPDEVKYHLAKHGFVPDYYVWDRHGETYIETDDNRNVYYSGGVESMMDYHTMVMDAAGPEFDPSNVEEPPNPDSQRFYDMLNAADKELWPGCTKHSQLSFVARTMHMKSEHHMSERNFDDMVQLVSEILPDDNTVPPNFYSTKKLLRGMGLPVEKIDCCNNGCMIYWGEDSDAMDCKFCGHARFRRATRGSGIRHKSDIAYKKMYYFPLTDRLKRLYASNATAKKMRWHAEHEIEDGVMIHCSDSPAWKHFNNTHPEFAVEPRNVRLCLCTDGFQPFAQYGSQYSCWPVIVTPLNLPPAVCMTDQHMFLTVLVPGPKNPKDKLDVYLQPLIKELNQLWDVGVQTYDISKKQNFQMRVALMWTVSDFPAYSMLSGWSTAGRLACPYCMESSDAFTLSKSGKQSWFDNHRKFLHPDHTYRRNKTSFLKNKMVTKIAPPVRSGVQVLTDIQNLGLMKVTDIGADEINRAKCKNCGWRKRSIFWELPYWSTNLIRHNLDVMHIEKNVFDNIFNTIMDVQGKTKDTPKSRQELNEYCRRPELARNEETGKYPKACYTLDKKGKETLCKWMKELKFPDGYVSNLSRCVDMKKYRFFGMKSHDCHVFMQRLMPIAFKELLPLHVWKALTEMSLFFKELTATVIRKEDMDRLHNEIPIILCRLEKIFPPSFFDSMEHLPVHLAYEASIAGPVQYRWMYPFERYLRKLKKNVTNKAKVEGSICNAYLVDEASSFCEYYFEEHVATRHRKAPRNDAGCSQWGEYEGCLSIFKFAGRPLGRAKARYLTEEEYNAARSYILLNCPEIEAYTGVYIASLKSNQSNISEEEIDACLENEFPDWFDKYAHDPFNDISNEYIQDLAKGPLRRVKTYSGYLVNGYKFHTLRCGSSKSTVNSGVCIKGSNLSVENNFYGQLVDIVEVEYPGFPNKRTVLFKCEWFDPTTRGTNIHDEYKLVEVHHKRRLNRYEPFILAMQAKQVYFCEYPGASRDKRDWWAVCNVKARAIVEIPIPSENNGQTQVVPPFQEDETIIHHLGQINMEEEVGPLNDPNGVFIDMDDEPIEEEDELIVESEMEDDFESNSNETLYVDPNEIDSD